MPSTEFEVPVGLDKLLQEFTVAVLRNQPANLNLFARDYFERKCLNENEDEDYRNNNGYSDDESGKVISLILYVVGDLLSFSQ